MSLDQSGERALRRSELTDQLEARMRHLRLLEQMIPADFVVVMVALVTAVLTEGPLQTGSLVVAFVLGLPLLAAYYIGRPSARAACAKLEEELLQLDEGGVGESTDRLEP